MISWCSKTGKDLNILNSKHSGKFVHFGPSVPWYLNGEFMAFYFIHTCFSWNISSWSTRNPWIIAHKINSTAKKSASKRATSITQKQCRVLTIYFTTEANEQVAERYVKWPSSEPIERPSRACRAYSLSVRWAQLSARLEFWVSQNWFYSGGPKTHKTFDPLAHNFPLSARWNFWAF